MSELRSFYRDYGLFIGGGNISTEVREKFQKKESKNLRDQIRQVEGQIGDNYESLSPNYVKSYQTLAKNISSSINTSFLTRLQTIGKLQLLRKLVTR